MNKQIIVVAAGYFDPIHVGHIEYLEKAKILGDKLIVIINNDNQTILKKGKPFMPQEERAKIVKALRSVDEVFMSIDEDPSVCKSLAAVKPNIFAKGGDRFGSEVPESGVCNEHGIQLVDGLGEKIQSSSWLIKKSEIKKLKFFEPLIKLILNGKKNTTWRINDDKNISKNDTLSLCDNNGKEFMETKVLETRETIFKDLTEKDKDGHEKFSSDEEMYKIYSNYYNMKVTPEIKLKVIKFQNES